MVCEKYRIQEDQVEETETCGRSCYRGVKILERANRASEYCIAWRWHFGTNKEVRWCRLMCRMVKRMAKPILRHLDFKQRAFA